jgi:histidine ammonia-lyase
MTRMAIDRPDVPTEVQIGERPLSIDDVVALARGSALPVLGRGVVERMQRSADVLERLHQRGEAIYGVTTSVGASVETRIPTARASELSLNVVRMHGCGTGRVLDDDEAAAVMAVRVASLAQGKSGVRPALAERIVELLARRVLPRIPSEGSVGRGTPFLSRSKNKGITCSVNVL